MSSKLRPRFQPPPPPRFATQTDACGHVFIGFWPCPSPCLAQVLARLPDIGAKVEYFMSTGNLNSPTALDQMQVCVGGHARGPVCGGP